ncbi:hypothetical protein PXK56_18085 [Phaeobacter gallaeciensis]|uniref:hypothetical protein n=1 Tax=Phaeobacter gallaeciensis TaxID=60890 RepID=UPI0023804D3A|nr:hypothetical protein [Phaeobacter gallaeciensis]MDE4297100.1 hypothetical protein [Phaeobacter gallaeciensis]
MSDLKSTDIVLDSGRVIRDSNVYGCVCDTANDDEADGCTIYTDPGCCTYETLPSGRKRRSRWGCKEWKRLGRAQSAQGARPHDF